MKLTSCFRTALCLSLAMTAFTPRVRSSPSMDQASELIRGQATNGIRGEIELLSSQGRLTDIVIWINDVSDATAASSQDTLINLERVTRNDWDYWMPTNSFCGPMELREENGRATAPRQPSDATLTNYHGQGFPIRPDVSSMAAYPVTYRLKDEHWRYFGRFTNGYSGPGVFPLPLFLTSPRSELVRFQPKNISATNDVYPVATLYDRRFQLEDYFEMRAPGKYQLTVQPKIYHRLATNDDICVRIDLPPITATFKWAGEKTK